MKQLQLLLHPNVVTKTGDKLNNCIEHNSLELHSYDEVDPKDCLVPETRHSTAKPDVSRCDESRGGQSAFLACGKESLK